MERIIEIRQTELNPTLRALSDAGGMVDDATWMRQGENAQHLISLIRQLQETPWPAGKKPMLALPPKLWEKVSETTIRVNLDYALRLPFNGAVVEWNKGSGWVTVELCDGELYIDGKKISLWLAEEQKKGTITGHNLRSQVEKLAGLHPNVMDALVEAWEQGLKLIPESWKVNVQGQILYTFFWGAGFRNSDGNLYARYLYWNEGQWLRDYRWLDSAWDVQNPAAVPAS